MREARRVRPELLVGEDPHVLPAEQELVAADRGVVVEVVENRARGLAGLDLEVLLERQVVPVARVLAHLLQGTRRPAGPPGGAG